HACHGIGIMISVWRSSTMTDITVTKRDASVRVSDKSVLGVDAAAHSIAMISTILFAKFLISHGLSDVRRSQDVVDAAVISSKLTERRSHDSFCLRIVEMGSLRIGIKALTCERNLITCKSGSAPVCRHDVFPGRCI